MKPPSSIAVAAIVKDEAPYIVEWISHHRLLGVGAFFIADNGSTDGTRDILLDLQENGIVEMVDWPNLDGERPQVPAYRHLLERYGSRVEWMAFLDLDEYIWPTYGSCLNLKEYLARADEHTGAIALNWATYGSSHKAVAGTAPTPLRFTQHASLDRPVNRHFKSIVRTEAVSDFTCPHNATLKKAWRYVHSDGTTKTSDSSIERPPAYAHSLSANVCWQHFRINHYIIRSWLEYLAKKSRRGRAFSANRLDHNYFMAHDFNDLQNLPPEGYESAITEQINFIERLLSKNSLALIGLSLTSIPKETRDPSTGHIDQVLMDNGCLRISGWVISWRDIPITGFQLKADQNRHATVDHWTSIERKDVSTMLPTKNTTSGFDIAYQFSDLAPPFDIEITPILSSGCKAWPLHARVESSLG